MGARVVDASENYRQTEQDILDRLGALEPSSVLAQYLKISLVIAASQDKDTLPGDGIRKVSGAQVGHACIRGRQDTPKKSSNCCCQTITLSLAALL